MAKLRYTDQADKEGTWKNMDKQRQDFIKHIGFKRPNVVNMDQRHWDLSWSTWQVATARAGATGALRTPVQSPASPDAMHPQFPLAGGPLHHWTHSLDAPPDPVETKI